MINQKVKKVLEILNFFKMGNEEGKKTDKEAEANQVEVHQVRTRLQIRKTCLSVFYDYNFMWVISQN